MLTFPQYMKKIFLKILRYKNKKKPFMRTTSMRMSFFADNIKQTLLKP